MNETKIKNMLVNRINVVLIIYLFFSLIFFIDSSISKNEFLISKDEASFYSEAGSQVSLSNSASGAIVHTYSSAQLFFKNNSMMLPGPSLTGKLRLHLEKGMIKIYVTRILNLSMAFEFGETIYKSRDFIYIKWSLVASLILISLAKILKVGEELFFWLSTIAFFLVVYITFFI